MEQIVLGYLHAGSASQALGKHINSCMNLAPVNYIGKYIKFPPLERFQGFSLKQMAATMHGFKKIHSNNIIAIQILLNEWKFQKLYRYNTTPIAKKTGSLKSDKQILLQLTESVCKDPAPVQELQYRCRRHSTSVNAASGQQK